MTADDVVALLAHSAGEPSGEADGLSALDHGLQCAFELSRSHPDDRELCVAGLVHDVGHALGPDEDHDRLGAALVRSVLGERVASLVGLHVVAKRYLVATDRSYRSLLSATSTRTLGLQGGPLDAEDAAEFASSPHAADAVELRRADEAAKVPGRVVPPLDAWVPALVELAALVDYPR